MSKICRAVSCVREVLDKSVCDAVAGAALDFYAQVIEFIKTNVGFDITVLFKVLAVLALVCWIQEWLLELVKFALGIPRFIKNLFCGKFSLCLFDNCNASSESSSDESSEY